MLHKTLHVVFTLFLISVITTLARADLNPKQARQVIAKIGGFTFEERSIHVNDVNSTGPDSAQVNAYVDAVFRLSQGKNELWQINEIRAGSGRWESLSTIAQASQLNLPAEQCSNYRSKPATLSAGRARCLIAALVGVKLPSDAVRIKEISTSNLSLGARPLAVVVSRIRLNLRLLKSGEQWQVEQVSCDDGLSLKVGDLYGAVNAIKRTTAKDELTEIASALEAFRKDRGSYVVGEEEAVLIDHLSPKYLRSVIRVDPWHYPYQYHGDSDHFTLTSVGPDGKAGTGDDVIVSN